MSHSGSTYVSAGVVVPPSLFQQRCAPPTTVAEYNLTYASSLDAKRFSLMNDAGQTAGASDTGGAEHMTWHGACDAQWNHWGNLGPLQNFCKGADVETPYLSCFEELSYEERIAALIDRFRAGDEIYPKGPDLSLV